LPRVVALSRDDSPTAGIGDVQRRIEELIVIQHVGEDKLGVHIEALREFDIFLNAGSVRDGKVSTPYQYTEAQLEALVKEAARVGRRVAVHATGEPGTLFAEQAGVASVDHADQLSDETIRLMKEKQIFAVPTFTI
jgi:imidazolonepropionase-like amidohydrolase